MFTARGTKSRSTQNLCLIQTSTALALNFNVTRTILEPVSMAIYPLDWAQKLNFGVFSKAEFRTIECLALQFKLENLVDLSELHSVVFLKLSGSILISMSTFLHICCGCEITLLCQLHWSSPTRTINHITPPSYTSRYIQLTIERQINGPKIPIYNIEFIIS
jgi:hypothetical protein